MAPRHRTAYRLLDPGAARLFAHLADAAFAADVAARRIVLWNRAAEALFGYPTEEALALPMDALLPLDLPVAYAACCDGDRTPVEVLALARGGGEVHVELTLSALDDGPAGGQYVLALARDITERVRLRVRQAAALRVARRLAADASRERVLDDLLEEAVAAIGGDGATVYRWTEPQGLLLVRNTVHVPANHLPTGRGVVGRAVERRAPVIVNDYQHEPGMVAATVRAGVQAAVAVPLQHEGHLLGALGVVSYRANKHFGGADAELLEVLAGVAAAVLVGLERARLEGALLAARTSAHEVGNTLTALVGHVQLLQRDPRLPADLASRADAVARQAREMAAKMRRLQELKEVNETRWEHVGSTINLTPPTPPE